MSDGLEDDVVKALGPVARAFEIMGVRFYVGGSVASSFHGAMRTTLDVDVVAELQDTHVTKFLAVLGETYYASEPAIRDAIRRSSSFNLIHLETSFKVDVFVNRRRPYDKSAFARAKIGNLGGTTIFEVPIASLEDSIISKLEWFRLGDEVSERQWHDVTTLVKLHGQTLDMNYLRSSANEVEVSDLLDRLLEQQNGP